MNWKKIEKKYPLAYDMFIDYHLKKIVFKAALHIWYLYDFFDEQKIYIDMDYTADGWQDDPRFQGCIYGAPVIFSKPYPSRRKAEKVIFKKAFKVLEERLTN